MANHLRGLRPHPTRPAPAFLRAVVVRIDQTSGAPVCTVPDWDDADTGPCEAVEVAGGWRVGDPALVVIAPSGTPFLIGRLPLIPPVTGETG